VLNVLSGHLKLWILSVADISEVYTASIFGVEMSRFRRVFMYIQVLVQHIHRGLMVAGTFFLSNGTVERACLMVTSIQRFLQSKKIIFL
jgi:hypothetical protein